MASVAKSEEIVFTGTLDEVDAHFRDQDWSDGHAFFPPTIEKVEEFLEHTDLARDEQIAILRPGNVAATPLNIAAFKPGGQYMGTYGYFLPFVIAENGEAVERIGWTPLHVEEGFAPGTSTVSLGNTLNFGSQARETSGTDIEGILRLICLEIV